MNTNKRDITFTPENVGDLLTEVVRAQMHSGCASSTVRRVLEGVVRFINQQVAESGDMEHCDRAVYADLRYGLEDMYIKLKSSEDHHYSM